MEQMLIVRISSLSAIIILSIVLLVNSIKTKNKLVMYLSIGTLVVSIGCLTYCLIHHFTSTKDDKDMKDIIKSTYQDIGDSIVKAARLNNGNTIDDFVVDPTSVDDGLTIVKSNKITLNELRQHSNTIKTDISKLLTTIVSRNEKDTNKIINDFSHEIYWISPVLDKFIIKILSSMMLINDK
jgi:hypothetical protein